MAVSFTFWDDCAEPKDLEAMWNTPDVSTEWLKAGESKGKRVHLSRDPDGQPYLTQTELRAVAEIVIGRHFPSKIDPAMVCAIAELESDRLLLVTRSEGKSKQRRFGLMQLMPNDSEWLISELGYSSYLAEGNSDVLYRPFINVYFGAAYIKWLSNFEDTERSEEFMVRAYKGGPKKATHKSTLPYWKRYLAVKESFPSRKSLDNIPLQSNALAGSLVPASENSGTNAYTLWDSRASPEDMEEMWNHPEVQKEWTKSKEKRGQVRFSLDEKNRPYLSRVEVKAVADIILFKYFSTKGIKSTVLCAISEVVSMRFLHGIGGRPGIMGIDYSTAFWLYVEMGYRAYRLESVEDLTKPFVSMYFGAAFVAWLSEFEGRERTPEFVVQAYLVGPKNVNPQDTGPLRLKYEEAISKYEEIKRNHGSCSIM
ncbi:uncharacterized protein LOC114758893 [Neltuma alba]|uniref:uncharacterized protein LOC114758893 n=1 Tax=Neltuma alba TaxID=207710 RepID=UPI0010A49B23|nr:uncharacterized protein LOC114758893 [Prosopis alba]